MDLYLAVARPRLLQQLAAHSVRLRVGRYSVKARLVSQRRRPMCLDSRLLLRQQAVRCLEAVQCLVELVGFHNTLNCYAKYYIKLIICLAPAAPTTAVTTTSIFGGGSALAPSAFGSSSFGSPAASSAFGQSSSVFGGGNAAAAQPVAAGGSMFSGGFGSPSAAPSAFGGPPAFGAPSFGGAATFGSPKAAGFGSFGQTAASPPAFAAQVTQKNSLFESLGSSESGMTFGNIAQNTNQAAPSAFGGANLAPNSNQAAPSAFGGG